MGQYRALIGGEYNYNSMDDSVSHLLVNSVAASVGTLSDEQLGSATRLLEREITIKGDEKTNTVLVSASPRHSERVRQLLEQLDVDPPQVLIGVMLAALHMSITSN